MMVMPKIRPTLKDVAILAGVSAKTVSNVLNGNSSRYSNETRGQIEAAIQQLGYIPNRAARSMRNGRIGLLGIAVPDIGNPYFAGLASEIIDEASRHEYLVLIQHTGGFREAEVRTIRGMYAQGVDGIIFSPIFVSPEDFKRDGQEIPTVLLGERAENRVYDHVVIDNVSAGYAATQHLIEQGYRHIGVIGVPDDEYDIMPHLRFQGYRRALNDANLPFDAQLVATIPAASSTFHDGADGMQQLLKTRREFDAVFCFNDRVALGAIRVLQQRGFKIPSDVGVIGFDDIDEGQYLTPTLSTISPDKIRIAQLALGLLLERLEGTRTGPPEQFLPSFQVIQRESTTR